MKIHMRIIAGLVSTVAVAGCVASEAPAQPELREFLRKLPVEQLQQKFQELLEDRAHMLDQLEVGPGSMYEGFRDGVVLTALAIMLPSYASTLSPNAKVAWAKWLAVNGVSVAAAVGVVLAGGKMLGAAARTGKAAQEVAQLEGMLQQIYDELQRRQKPRIAKTSAAEKAASVSEKLGEVTP